MYRLFNENLINSSWSEKMRLLRLHKKWTQEEAAERCSTHHKTYWSWENGVNTPRKSSQKVIAKAFKVKVEDLFSDILIKSMIMIIFCFS